MASSATKEVGVIDSVELEPFIQPNNNNTNNEQHDDNVTNPTTTTTATITIIKPHATTSSAVSLASDNEPNNAERTHLNVSPTPMQAAIPSTSRQLFREAANLHGGHDTTTFLQQEIGQQQRLKSASSTLDKSVSRNPSSAGKHEKKIGHRRVDDEGEVTYKKIQSKQIMGSIQLGIQHTVGSLASKPKRDLLMNDFFEMETISFPPDGSSLTPAHHYSEFRFKVYAPIAFRYFRDLFGIAPDDFLMSMCAAPLRQLSNPGASGSIFYLTDDDEFIIKTVQKKECEFLQKLLPGYYMNLSQNPRTLLPKFFGLYCFHYNAKNVRLVAMNNLLPSDIKMHAKYDLKGSTFRRKASKAERQKASPTYKDLDFMERHPNGIFLETDKYNALMKTIQRDCMVLESFQIMDYSLLVGIHNLDLAAKEKREERIRNARAKLQRADEIREADEHPEADQIYNAAASSSAAAGSALNRSRSMNRQRLVAHSTAMESITADIDTPFEEDEDIPAGGIPARSENDERLILYIGIIDILQSYRLEKKLEHTFKSIIYNGDTVSVCRPSFYAQRFQSFMGKTVFKKTPTFPLKHSPSKRKTSTSTMRTPQRTPSQSISSNIRPPLMSGSSTPPPAFDDISEEDITANSSSGLRLSTLSQRNLVPQRSYMSSHRSTLGSTTDDYSDDDLASASGGSARSPVQRKKGQLHLSKTNVQVTTIGCIEDEPTAGQQQQHSDHKQSDEGIEQDVEGKRIVTTKSTVISTTQEQMYTSTLVVNDIRDLYTLHRQPKSDCKMPFQRSYSKVWWGSDDNHMPAINPANQHLFNSNPISLTSGGLYSYFSQQPPPQAQPQQQHHQQHRQPFFYYHQPQQQQFGGSAYHSLDLNQYKGYGGNLSRIQEVEDEHNISKLSWEKHDSPGSLRSQDSGFSDNDEFHSLRSLSGRSSKASTPSSKSNRSAKSDMDSPSSTRTVATPPTVIRRTGNSEFYAPLVNVSRRISFSSSSSTPNQQTPSKDSDEGTSLLDKLDSMQLLTESPVAKKLDFNDSNATQSSDANSPIKGHNPRVKKRRKVQRKPTSPLSPAYKRWQKLNDQMEEEEEEHEQENQNQGKELNSTASAKEYNNETVYLGAGTPTCCTPPPPYNNETVILGGNNSSLNLDPQGVSPLRLETRFNGNTSTPKLLKATNTRSCTLPPLYSFNVYDNTLLNGHTEDIQHWLDDLRMSYDHEVMSTLQTKSIAQEAFKNLQITTNTVAKFIRQLQQKALPLQTAFEKVERMLSGVHDVSLSEAVTSSLQLLQHVQEFTYVLERRSVFFADSRLERKRYEDYLDQIRMVNKDTRYSLDNQHYINLESLLEDLQVLKRILLITIHQVYEKLVRILVLSIENGRCDLMLKANINMIATLMNIDYDGFASLTNAFVQTEAVRTLLVVCLDHKLSSVRAQALRALATICCAPEPIAQLGACGGVEIIRDILQVSGSKKPQNGIQRGDMEKREAVSLLTQITAAWHGPDHKVSGIKACVEAIVEGLTQLLVFTECPQTLLLCTAALNNLSRMEITAHYSIMSHETIFKLITTMEERDKGITVFLYEQIASMLYNMSLNKKCHSHLANAGIINFITYAYETEFYKSYNSRGESEAQKRCIKTILHTLTRLVKDSVLGMELLEQQKHLPSSLVLKLNTTQQQQQQLSSSSSLLDANSNTSRDISLVVQQLLEEAKHCRHEQLQQHYRQENQENHGKKTKLQLQRQESYV